MSGAKAGDNPNGWRPSVTLYNAQGERKYLNQAERRRLARTALRLKRSRMLFVMVLMLTGARVSEVLLLSAGSFQLGEGSVSIKTLKRRRLCVREVPLPAWLLEGLENQFALSERQSAPDACHSPLWPFSRWTAWRLVKKLMGRAGIAGPRACPKGFRHGFGVGDAQAGVPVTLLQRWLGHAQLATTAIYLDVAGPEEREIAARFWEKL
jgi:integrase